MEIDLLELNEQDNAVKPSPTYALDSFQAAEDHSNMATPTLSDKSVLGFRVGSLGLLLDANIFCEIIDQAKVSLFPNVQPWLGGVLNLRGNIVPVIDLHILLEEPNADFKNRRLLAVDSGKKTVAFWIDGYPHMLDTDFQIVSSPSNLPDILKHAVTECRQQDKQIWLTITLDKLFKALSSHTVQARV